MLILAALFSGGYYYVAPGLPHAEQLRDVRLQIPFSVYSRDGRLIAQFGEKQRTPVRFDEVPPMLVQAVLAAEDDRFFEHPGFDYQGIMRAGLNFLLNAGDRSQGGSTITQQVAREYFLSRDRTFVRKFKELILAIRIEREFSKAEILELYLNTIFLGQHAYGVVAAAQIYFGKELEQLTVADAALIAGIPQGPSILNPVSNPDAATQRRAYVLRRMRELGFISAGEYEAALLQPVEAVRFGPQLELEAPYVAEMVRAEVVRRLGPAAYEAGLRVRTTVDSRLQRAAREALRNGLMDYDARHGYRGPITRVDPGTLVSKDGASLEGHWQALLADYPSVAGFRTGLVVSVNEIAASPGGGADKPAEADPPDAGDEAAPRDQAVVYLEGLGLTTVGLESVDWAAPYVNDDRVGDPPESVAEVLSSGDIARFRSTESGAWRLAQVPEAQGALVALDPQDGGISALVGGFDFFLSNYNRATQSQRQPGSAFKPFVYSAALENGFTAASIVNDAPIVEVSSELEAVWRPENYSGSFSGPTRLREALVRSLNLVSVRVIRQAGIGHTVRHLRAFGFDDTALPRNPTLALGAGGVAPLDLVRGYAAFANGGYRVAPYLIDTIEDAEGDVLYAARPRSACQGCEEPRESQAPELVREPFELYPDSGDAPRAISPQNAYLMNDMMQDVVQRGTGARAYRELGRGDLRGKTGTSNDRRDAWFAGFNGDVVAAVWVGFDQERSLGNREQGALTALPVWVDFMGEALAGQPLNAMERPPGIIDVRINPDTGLVASASQGSIFEKFQIGRVPDREEEGAEWRPGPLMADPQREAESRAEPLF
jgi:penicillin-binding protein 1A